MRTVAIVRAGALLIGSATIVVSVLWAVSSYDNTEARLHASPCSGGVPTPAADANGCLAFEVDVVTGLSTGEDSGSDTTYEIDYLRGSSALEQRQGVTESLYNAVAAGSGLLAQTWQGNVTGLFAQNDGNVGTAVTPPGDDHLMFAGTGIWVGLSLLLWFLLGDGKLRHLSVIRLFVWTLAGCSFVGVFYISVVGQNIWFEAAFACCGLLGMFASFFELNEFDDGEKSLGSRAWARWQRRKESKA